jgi:hypothetical protein
MSPEEYAIVSTWSDEQSKCVYLKYALSLVDDAVVLGDCVEVKVKYLTQEEVTALDSANASTDVDVNDDKKDDEVDGQCADDNNDDNEDKNGECAKTEDEDDASNDSQTSDEDAPAADEEDKKKEDDQFVDNNEEDKKDEDDQTDQQVSAEDDGNKDEDDFSANTQIEGAVNNASQSIVENKENEQVGTSATSASATALSDSEKAELEHYRREEKQRMISEYKGELSEEILNSFVENIDTFTKEELEAKLAIEYRKFKKSSKNDDTNKTITAFSLLSSANNADYDETNSADVINKYARKNK